MDNGNKWIYYALSEVVKMGFIETSYGGNVTLSNVDIDSDLNLKNEYDLIGVKRFVCQDYLGAVIGTASNVERKKIHIDITGDQYSEMIRIPSNFVQGSTFRVIVTAAQESNQERIKYSQKECYYVSNNKPAYAICYSDVFVYKYDPVNETYSLIADIITDGTVISGNKRYYDVSGLNAGDYICIKTESKTESIVSAENTLYVILTSGNYIIPYSVTTNVTGSSTVNSDFSVCCDMVAYPAADAIWDSEDI